MPTPIGGQNAVKDPWRALSPSCGYASSSPIRAAA